MARHPTWRNPAESPVAAFAAELRELRERAGDKAATVDQIGRRTGIARSTLYTALKGDRIPGQDVVRALAKAWGGDEEEWIARRREVQRQSGVKRHRDRESERTAQKSGTTIVDLDLQNIGHVAGVWSPQPKEVQAAWEIYLEIVTRVPIIDVPITSADPQEVNASFLQLFDVIRGIIRNAGPQIASKKSGDINLGKLTIAILNGVIRPTLAKWHPQLTARELQQPGGRYSVDTQQQWDGLTEYLHDIDRVRTSLVQFAQLLAQAIDVDHELFTSKPLTNRSSAWSNTWPPSRPGTSARS